jgi:hypothetical protein
LEWDNNGSSPEQKMKSLFNQINHKKQRLEKGVAGLELLLSVVIMLFIIGFLVMIFVIIGGEISGDDSVDQAAGPYRVNIQAAHITNNTAGFQLTTCATCTNGQAVIKNVTNATGASLTMTATEYAVSKCYLKPAGPSTFNGTGVNVTYDYYCSSTAFDVINDTATEMSDVTDWFGIIIVISAMVVLILLTVVIISAIRGTGVAIGGGGGAQKTTA